MGLMSAINTYVCLFLLLLGTALNNSSADKSIGAQTETLTSMPTPAKGRVLKPDYHPRPAIGGKDQYQPCDPYFGCIGGSYPGGGGGYPFCYRAPGCSRRFVPGGGKH